MGVPAQIFYHLLGPAKGTLGVHHPAFGKQAVYQCFISKATTPKRLYILGPEHFTDCLYRKQIFITAQLLMPAAVFIHAATGHYAVQVRVQAQVLSRTPLENVLTFDLWSRIMCMF